MTAHEEAEKILELFNGDTARAFDLVSNHLVILQTRGHILMTLAGIIVTVSGFSGRLIAGTHLFSQITIITGVFLAVSSAFWIFAVVMRIQWLTQNLDKTPVDALAAGITMRNYKQKHFHRAMILFACGALFYACSLFSMLINPNSGALTPRSAPNYSVPK
jgi:hypothetical protein